MLRWPARGQRRWAFDGRCSCWTCSYNGWAIRRCLKENRGSLIVMFTRGSHRRFNRWKNGGMLCWSHRVVSGSRRRYFGRSICRLHRRTVWGNTRLGTSSSRPHCFLCWIVLLYTSLFPLLDCFAVQERKPKESLVS